MSHSEQLSIVVLSGGISHERDISLRSGRCVAEALSSVGHTVTVREPDPLFLASLTENPPDVIWPALHGASGEDGGLRSILERSHIPFVGSRSAECQLTWSKPVAKALAGRAGISTPTSVTLAKETFRELGASRVLGVILQDMPTPVVVKPAHGGSAQGVTIVEQAADLPRAMVEAYTYADVALIEKHIAGTEVSVSIIDDGTGPDVLPAVQIEPLEGVYSFEARYNAGKTFFSVPPRLPQTTTDNICATALAAYELFGLRHLARIDFIVDADATPWFLEANILPGLTETSLLPQSIKAAGLNPGVVYSNLAQAAIADTRK